MEVASSAPKMTTMTLKACLRRLRSLLFDQQRREARRKSFKTYVRLLRMVINVTRCSGSHTLFSWILPGIRPFFGQSSLDGSFFG